MITLNERKEIALDLRRKGCSCASAVLMSFDDVTLLDADTALRITNGMGTGIAGTRELCGAAAAMAIVEGFLHPADPTQKGRVATDARSLIEQFAVRNHGCLRCAELKSRQASGQIRPCNDLVLDCVELLHNSLPTKAGSTKQGTRL